MKGNNEQTEMAGDEMAELLRQVLHLKQYETPEIARMTRNKQNIMRRVREVQLKRRRTLGELIEINMPWLFAEPRYGIALLFIAFAALQYVGINARQAMDGNTGIYTSTESVADIGRAAAVSTNRIDYPKVPDNFQLFPQQQADSDVKFVGRLEEQE